MSALERFTPDTNSQAKILDSSEKMDVGSNSRLTSAPRCRKLYVGGRRLPVFPAYPSIRGRQPAGSKFDMTVGELTPIFDNGRIATGWTFVEDLAGLSPSFLQRQSEIFIWQAVIVALVAKSARPIRDTVRSSHCVNLNVWGKSFRGRNERLL